jgi:hypothetical protein
MSDLAERGEAQLAFYWSHVHGTSAKLLSSPVGIGEAFLGNKAIASAIPLLSGTSVRVCNFAGSRRGDVSGRKRLGNSRPYLSHLRDSSLAGTGR